MEKSETIYLKDYKLPKFFVDHVDLTFDINEEWTKVTSILKIHKNLDAVNKNSSLVFNKDNFEITQVVADEMVLLPGEYEVGENFFKLANTPDNFQLEITSILKPHENTTLEGLYKSGTIFCTQCEANGFRKITPFPDRPDVMAVYSCTIIADKTRYPVLLSNGNMVDCGDLDNNRHFVRWEDPHKKTSYLFALVAGDLKHIHDQFTTRSKKNIDLKIYCEKENIDKCDYAMQSLKQAMEWDEKRFNLEYDLDLYQIVAINDFNAGAMENKGLNIFNAKYVLANPETAADEDFLNIQAVIGHEYFHNWTGNRVTLKNWFQLSLKEGLTVFRDQEFSSDMNSRGVKRISSVRKLKAYQFPEDAGPMTHPVRPESYIKMDNFYTMTVYEKGAELVRMIHQLVGEENFIKGISLYFKKFDGMAVTIEDFTDVMQEVSNLDLEQFKLWYSQSGTPVVSVKRSYDPDSRQLKITFEQKTKPDRNQSEKQPLHIPVDFAIIDSNGKDITPEGNALLELKSEKQTFEFNDIPENSLPSIFRQFSAPVKTRTDFTDHELAFLMANDTDEFNRWDAAQTLFIKEIKQIVNSVRANKKMSVSSNLINACKKALNDEKADKAFLAKTLALPMETEIKDYFDNIDVDAIHKSRLFLKQTLARQLKYVFLDIIDNCMKSDPLSISRDAMADRSLKNLSLSFIGSLQDTESTQLVLQHYESAQNMTDEIKCLEILCEIDPEIKQKSVEKFYSKWKHDKLVLDKWFAVQAGSTLDNTLEKVKALTQHRDFSITNPNKVRALIYMFAMHNPFTFHQKDGSGYSFISDQIIRLDSINHQVAARLSSCFNEWKKYDDTRKEFMKKELERILSIPTLSGNVYEIVSKAVQ